MSSGSGAAGPVRDAAADLSSTADGLDHPEGVSWFDGGI